MTKHTPGPWAIRETATHIAVIGANNEALFHEYKGNTGVKEDARLIAAAPDLLNALQAIVKSLADQDDEGMIEHAQQMIDARAAIAKATGEQA